MAVNLERCRHSMKINTPAAHAAPVAPRAQVPRGRGFRAFIRRASPVRFTNSAPLTPSSTKTSLVVDNPALADGGGRGRAGPAA